MSEPGGHDNDFNTRVLDKTLELMEQQGRFIRLTCCGERNERTVVTARVRPAGR